jgi:hypothetical protein
MLLTQNAVLWIHFINCVWTYISDHQRASVCLFSPLRWTQGRDHRHSTWALMMFLCEGETPCIFFLMTRQPFVFLRARAPPRAPPEGRSLGGAHGPPRCSLHLSPCCGLVVHVDDVVADILSSMRHLLPPNCAQLSLLRLIVCLAVVFVLSPLRWQQGREHRRQM